MLNYHLPDGRRLAYRRLGAGPPLILLHGWAMSSAVFSEVAERLAPDFSLFIPDLPGHGASDPAPHYTLSSLLADLEVWRQQLRIAACSVLGWSLGGQLALQWVLQYPEHVQRLLLVATTPKFVAAPDWDGGLPSGQVRAMERQLKRNFAAAMSDFFSRMFTGENLSRERYRQIIRFAVRDSRLPAATDVLACLDILRDVDLRMQLPTLQLPALVHFGALDEITPPAAGHALAAALSAVEKVCWDGVGHAPFLTNPEASVELWKGFLQG